MLEKVKQELEAGGRHILEILFKNKVISAQQFADVTAEVERTKKTALAVLKEKNLVSEEVIISAYSELFGIPVVDLKKQKINLEALNTFAIEAMKVYKMVVFDADNKVYKVAMADPLSETAWAALESLDAKDEKDVDLYLTTPAQIDFAISYLKEMSKKPEGEAAKIFAPKIEPKPILDTETSPAPSPAKPSLLTPPAVQAPSVLSRAEEKREALLSSQTIAPAEKKEEEKAEEKEGKKETKKLEKIEKPKKEKEEAAEGEIEFEVVEKAPVTVPVKPAVTSAPSETAKIPPAAPKPAKILPAKAPSTPLAEADLTSMAEQEVKTVEALQRAITGATVPKIVGEIMRAGIEMRASDIHIQPEEKEARVRLRIDGMLQDTITLPKEIHNALVARIKILSHLKIDETRLPQKGVFRVAYQRRAIDFYVSTFPTIMQAERVEIRILDKGAAPLELESLGIRGTAFNKLKTALGLPYGLILVVGPRGSGKSTTMYAMLNYLNKPEKSIVTVENPVEYTIAGVSQSEINPKLGLSTAEALRFAMLQDPNVILVSEITDIDTAELAVHAALTGHIVISSLSVSESTEALTRLVDLGVPPYLVTSAIGAVVSQRLVRRICPDDRLEAVLPPEVIEEIKSEIAAIPSEEAKGYVIDEKTKFFEGNPKSCGGSPYRGRIGIYEVLTMSPKLEQLVVSKERGKILRETACREGMMTLRQDGALKVLDGLTTWEEVLRVTSVEKAT
jgi:type IV pilus assembly protein PilB